MIHVIIPPHLRTLSKTGSEITLDLRATAPGVGKITQRALLDAIEERYPMLRGTIRDYTTQKRRAYLRFFACEEDISDDLPDTPLPEAVLSGKEPFIVIGAVAGG